MVANTGYDPRPHGQGVERILVKDGLAAYQVVGEVMAHQAYDG